jgi:hypothetical protein
MKKVIITFGLISGVIVSGMLVLSFKATESGMANGEIIGYATMIIAFATIFVALKNQRDRSSDGGLTFGAGFKTGLGITLVASFLYIISWLIISETIAKDFMAKYYQQSVEQLQASDLSEDEINAKIDEMKSFQELYKNPIVKIGITFLEIFPVGLLMSVIAALVFKKKPR